MAKKKEAPVEGEEAPKKKKPIKLILVVVVVGVCVKMFVLKDPPPTAAQQKAAALQAQQALYNKCAEANHLPTLGDMVIGAEPGTASTSKGAKATATSAAETPVTAPGVEGPILPGDQSVKLILRDGNFLQVGLAIQLPVGALAKTAKDDGLLSKATDLALTTLAKNEMKDLVSPEARDKIKQQLSFDTCRETNAAIMSILFTEFVMSSK